MEHAEKVQFENYINLCILISNMSNVQRVKVNKYRVENKVFKCTVIYIWSDK